MQVQTIHPRSKNEVSSQTHTLRSHKALSAMTVLAPRPEAIGLKFRPTGKESAEQVRRKIRDWFWRSLWRKQQQDLEEKNSGHETSPAESPLSPSSSHSSDTISFLSSNPSTCPSCGFSVRGVSIAATRRAQMQQALATTRQVSDATKREDSRRESQQRILYHKRIDPATFIKTEKTSRSRKPEPPCIYTVKGLDFVCLRG